MALMDRITALVLGGRALDIAEQVARRAGQGEAPPAVGRLPPRPRAAYDRLVDALNRLPRPVMVLGTLALIGTALAAPTWFADRMNALAEMPEGLWWIIGAVVSLHFGARYQDHAQAFEREIVEAVVARPVPEEPPEAGTPAVAKPGADAEVVLGTLATGPNAALADWRAEATTRA